jgi:hypothetical protein
MHAVRAHYDHLAAQRTQFYGNLWYDPEPRTTVSPDHEDLAFMPRDLAKANRELASRLDDLQVDRDRLTVQLEDAERREAELEGRLDGILSHPAIRLARRARNLATGVRSSGDQGGQS